MSFFHMWFLLLNLVVSYFTKMVENSKNCTRASGSWSRGETSESGICCDVLNMCESSVLGEKVEVEQQIIETNHKFNV